tara:strand:+ start:217 stop:669 length:453 start_codon:yes stop_codon:yes gene_type:complete
MDKYLLKQDWILWNHGLHDKSWKNDSYCEIFSIQYLFDVKTILDNLSVESLKNGMFFFMKTGIFPTWEDHHNRNGFNISYKVPLNHLETSWSTLLLKVLTDDDDNINGISISPKKEFNIIKLWVNKNDRNIFNLDRYINAKNGRIKRNIG